MWFQGNNSDNSRIYPWTPFSLLTHVSSSPFVSLFLPPAPLPTSPQESCTFPLSSACFALAPPQSGKGCFPLRMRSGLHPKCGLAFFACCVLLQRHKLSQRIWRNLLLQYPSAPLWHAPSDTEAISGVKVQACSWVCSSRPLLNSDAPKSAWVHSHHRAFGLKLICSSEGWLPSYSKTLYQQWHLLHQLHWGLSQEDLSCISLISSYLRKLLRTGAILQDTLKKAHEFNTKYQPAFRAA